MKNIALAVVAMALILTAQACANKTSPASPSTVAAVAQK
jgi:hypothetical protein